MCDFIFSSDKAEAAACNNIVKEIGVDLKSGELKKDYENVRNIMGKIDDPCGILFLNDQNAANACDGFITKLGDELISGRATDIFDAPKKLKIANFIIISMLIIIIILLFIGLYFLWRNASFRGVAR